MPGSGKSTLGIELAGFLNSLFVDLDEEIEKEEGLTIKEIFSEYGEESFRQIEADLLRKLSNSSDSFVMSTGGGTPCYSDSIDVMNATGYTIFLDVSTEELCRRLEDKKEIRPLLAERDSLKNAINELLFTRFDYYTNATTVVKSDSITVQNLVAVIS